MQPRHSIRATLLLLAFTCVARSDDGPVGSLRAGAAAVDISPQALPALMNGGFTQRSANRVADPLHARSLVVSDGKETCQGDPCELVRSLRNRGVEITVHVVGFDVTAEEREQLNCVAEAGGGKYADAATADELTAALSDIRQSVVSEVAERDEVRRGATVPIDRSEANWRMESEGTIYEGQLARFYTLKGEPMIQLINRDAVNVGLAIGGEMKGERLVTYAFFAEGRGPICERVGPEDSFWINFEPAEHGWLTGTFSGILGCPEFRAMPVEGSFHIKTPQAGR